MTTTTDERIMIHFWTVDAYGTRAEWQKYLAELDDLPNTTDAEKREAKRAIKAALKGE